jgi:betaine-aldehyde dehydrogenase
MGPLIDKANVARVDAVVNQAIVAGVKVLLKTDNIVCRALCG